MSLISLPRRPPNFYPNYITLWLFERIWGIIIATGDGKFSPSIEGKRMAQRVRICVQSWCKTRPITIYEACRHRRIECLTLRRISPRVLF